METAWTARWGEALEECRLGQGLVVVKNNYLNDGFKEIQIASMSDE